MCAAPLHRRGVVVSFVWMELKQQYPEVAYELVDLVFVVFGTGYNCPHNNLYASGKPDVCLPGLWISV